jgi:hypothetical protein
VSLVICPLISIGFFLGLLFCLHFRFRLNSKYFFKEKTEKRKQEASSAAITMRYKSRRVGKGSAAHYARGELGRYYLSCPFSPFRMKIYYPYIKRKWDMNTAIALKIENAFGLVEDALVILKAYYDIQKEKSLQVKRPDITHLKKSLFSDTDINTINWEKQSNAVIRRIFERGTISEKKYY